MLSGDDRISQSRLAFASEALHVGGFAVLSPIALDDSPLADEVADTPLVVCCDDAGIEAVLGRLSGHRAPIVVVAEPAEGSEARPQIHLFPGCDVYEAMRTLYLEATSEEES